MSLNLMRALSEQSHIVFSQAQYCMGCQPTPGRLWNIVLSQDIRWKIPRSIKIAVEVQNLAQGVVYINYSESPHVIELAKPTRRFRFAYISEMFFIRTA